jgi:hypothetical protein
VEKILKYRLRQAFGDDVAGANSDAPDSDGSLRWMNAVAACGGFGSVLRGGHTMRRLKLRSAAVYTLGASLSRPRAAVKGVATAKCVVLSFQIGRFVTPPKPVSEYLRTRC